MQIAWNRINTLLLALVLLVLAGALARGALGGPLDPPPGPPAPTMKTLDQVEPRIPVYAPLDGIFPIIINKPGSYYLTGNITGVAGQDGIHVDAHDVTIDLNGFALNGVASSGTGIVSTGWNTYVLNGGVSNWGGRGAWFTAPNAHFKRVQVRSNAWGGILCAGGIVEESEATNNTGAGIAMVGGGVIRGSYAADNGTGIVTSGPVIAEDNNVASNGLGIQVGGGIGGTVRDNTVTGSTNGGIYVATERTRIEGNTVTGNLPGTTAYGIRVVNGQHNIVVRNTATYNVDNFDIAAGNTAGPEEMAAATSPWSNVNY